MERKEKSKFSPPAVGGSALLVAFAVLCLTVFALLSLSTVRADSRMGEASRKAVSDYYAADVKAQEVLARLRTGEDTGDVQVMSTSVRYMDREEEYVSYTVPISDTQELQVEAVCRNGTWTVDRWQAVPIGGEELDEGLDLWDGGGLF